MDYSLFKNTDGTVVTAAVTATDNNNNNSNNNYYYRNLNHLVVNEF